jgi:hypothetical protein
LPPALAGGERIDNKHLNISILTTLKQNKSISLKNMKNKRTYSKNIRLAVILLSVVFALTPCSVKSSFFSVFDIEYFQTLNKNQTTQTGTSYCEVQESSVNQSENNVEILKKQIPVLPVSISQKDIYFATALHRKDIYVNVTAVNKPPLYILYKRLKSDLA